ncbi:MAG: cation diffusion facilitator family transporter [Rikenellaceae bacterium]
MAHQHTHNHTHNHTTKNIAVAFFMNLLFAVIELVGGLLTNSIAILSDALHDFGDSLSLALAWYLEKVSKRNTTQKYSYGFKRFSLLGAIINSLILLVGSLIVIYESVNRLINPQEVEAAGMFWLAIFGVAVNGFVFLRSRKSNSLNERVVALHFLEDVLGWVAVLIASVVMMFVEIPKLDSFLSIAISIYILYNIYHNLNSSIRVILQEVPFGIDIPKIKKEISLIKGVAKVGDVHLWSLDSEYNIGSVMVVADENITSLTDAYGVVKEVREVLKKHDVDHTTIEIEPFDAECELLCPIDKAH